MSDEQARLEEQAIKALSEALSQRNRIRWAKASPAQRKRQGALLAAGRKRAAKARRRRGKR